MSQPTPTSWQMDDSPASIAQDIEAVGAIAAIPPMLRILCDSTGMGFAAVARVTAGTWTACAVQDNIAFGLKAGGQLPVDSTLCVEARAAREPVVFDQASTDPKYKDHHTPRMYNIESYISVPIILSDGMYFGNLCAIDPHPRQISSVETIAMFTSFAELIAAQLQTEREALKVASALFDAQKERKAREAFIAVLGHDLRSPLASISMSAELLQRASDAKVVATAARIRASSARIAKLVDDVVDLARGRLVDSISISVVPVESLQSLIDDVIEELRTAYPDRSIHSRVDVNRTVNCDPVRVQQLVSNLIGNALQHASPEKPIVLSAELNPGGDILEVAILHEGEPIPESLRHSVFDPYWGVDAAPAGDRWRQLGLYISSQIAKAHGGQIRVDSSAESGTLFVAELRV